MALPAATKKTMSDAVAEKFSQYPNTVQPIMLQLRELALGCAGEPDIDAVTETLKWSEPSYQAKHGSTLRMDWKSKSPDQIGVYFTCTSILVETFKEVYGDLFLYEGKRAILLDLDQEIPKAQLQHCMSLALSYHKRKHLPLLGV